MKHYWCSPSSCASIDYKFIKCKLKIKYKLLCYVKDRERESKSGELISLVVEVTEARHTLHDIAHFHRPRNYVSPNIFALLLVYITSNLVHSSLQLFGSSRLIL